MPTAFKETDWKRLRQLHPVALERLCQRILAEVEEINNDGAKSYHQRYLDVFGVIRERDKDIARTFDNPRRSAALLQLAALRSQGLLTDDEFLQFSEETRGLIVRLLGTLTTCSSPTTVDS